MPLNPAILMGGAGGAGIPQVDPFQTLQTLMSLKQQRQQADYMAALTEKQRRAQQGEDAFQRIVKSRTRDTGVPDWDGVVNALSAEGYGEEALAIGKQVQEIRAKEYDAGVKSLEHTSAKLKLVSGMVRGMQAEIGKTESPELQQQIFLRHRGDIAKMVGADMAERLGDRYDPQRIEGAIAFGETAADSIARQRLAMDQLKQASELKDSDQKRDDLYLASYTNALSAATNQQEWSRVRQMYDGQGLPDKIRQVLPAEFSPQNLQLATRLAIDTKDRLQMLETTRHNRVTEANAAANTGLRKRELDLQEGEAMDLTPEAKRIMAQNFAMTGQLPAMGQGKHAGKQKTEIANLAGEIYKGLDLPSQRAAYVSNLDSLKKQQGTLDAVNAFEAMTTKNIDVFLEQAQKIADSGSPWLNKPLREMDDKLLGSPQMAGFALARRIAVNELSRVLTQQNMTGVLSDTARQEVDELLGPNATLKQYLEAATIAKRDMQNRKTTLTENVDLIKQRIATPPAGMTAPGTTPPMGAALGGDEQEQNGWIYKVTRDASGKVISGVPIRPATPPR